MANKIGDILLLFSCLFLLFKYNSLSFNNIFFLSNLNIISILSLSQYEYTDLGYFITMNNNITYILHNFIYNNNINYFINNYIVLSISTIICLFIIIASICKSAQAGFHF